MLDMGEHGWPKADFGPAKAAGRSQTRPAEGIGPCESTSDMNESLCPITVEQKQNEQ